MLVISRQAGESIVVSDRTGACVLTLLRVSGGDVTLLVSHGPVDKPGMLDVWTTALSLDGSFKVGRTAQATLVDLRDTKARIGIIADKAANVHRLEVWEAIHPRVPRPTGGEEEDGLSGSPVPRPNGPKPPTFDVRLNETPPKDGGDE